MTNGKPDRAGSGGRSERPPLAVARGRRTGAFTLIEVLVVVAIIALLISILLPSLKQAREQSYTVKCVSNLKALGTAMGAYLAQYQDVFPWGPTNEPNKTGYARHHFYGGKRGKGDKMSPWTSYAPGGTSDIPPELRPMNRMLTNRGLGDASELNVFECPKDTGVRSRKSYVAPKSDRSSYDVCGTSYQANVTWYEYLVRVEAANTSLVPSLEKRAYKLMKRYVPLMAKKGASRVIMIHEDPSDCTLGGVFYDWDKDFRYLGWHGKPNQQGVTFLDGHAENLYIEFKKVLDHNYKGAGGGFNDACNPAVGDDCRQGDARWIARHDFMAE